MRRPCRFLLFVSLLLLSCFGGLKKTKAHFFAMDTLVEITLFVPSASEGDRVLAELKKEAGRIDTVFSPTNAESEVKKINERRDRARAITTPEVAALVKTACEFSNETHGAFDITLGPIKWLWGFSTDSLPHRPDSVSLKNLLKHAGYDKITFQGDTLLFSDPETRIDLGGIAKGYALVRMEAIVRSHNIRAYCINAGGDIVLGDPKPGKELWHIGIQHPRDKDRAIKMLDESNLCIATSGDYERYFDEGGVRYHHIFDPKTGRPAVGLSSATVLCRDPVRAVVYSKVLIVNRAKDGLGNLPGILSYTVIDTAMRVRMFEKGKPVKG